jgi:uncharacterized protein YjiS (DUF1127 family)
VIPPSGSGSWLSAALQAQPDPHIPQHRGNLHIAELYRDNMTWKKSMLTLNHRHGDTSPLPLDWLARIASTIARFWSRSRLERHVRLMSAELRALDDRMLKDIGLQRCQIESAIPHGGRAEWYAPLADTGWLAAPISQTHRTMPARSLTERHNNHDI